MTSQQPPCESATDETIHTRLSTQNAFLVSAKIGGMSYKQIRETGNFHEAESTLRGRFRSLTKDKHDRVRKPMWRGVDARLLIEGVGRLADSGLTRGIVDVGKVPWKKVAE